MKGQVQECWQEGIWPGVGAASCWVSSSSNECCIPRSVFSIGASVTLWRR